MYNPQYKFLHICKFGTCQEMKKTLEAIHTEISAAGSIICKTELRSMLRVLRRLEFIDSEGVVMKKGQVALCFNSADELVLTDMLFHGEISDLKPHQIAALCSCLIWREGLPKKDLKVRIESVTVHHTRQDMDHIFLCLSSYQKKSWIYIVLFKIVPGALGKYVLIAKL